MKVFVSFDMEVLDIPYAVEYIRKVAGIHNLNIHDGSGHWFQETRRCECGSHFWKDAPEPDKVQCPKCDRKYFIQ